ncbi:MAG: hypothetical protein QM617_04850 [Comamonas sp.]
MSRLDYFADAHNAHHLGRGEVHFTAPLLPAGGGVNMAAYGVRWGNNWPAQPATPGELRLPPGRFVGNARGLTLTPTVRRLATSAWDTRGNLVVDAVEASLVLHGHGAANLVDALHAVRTRPDSRQASETIHTGRASIEAGCTLFTRHLVDLAQPVLVQPSWADWEEGVHWRRTAHGVLIAAGFSGPIGSSIQIRYTPEGSADTLDALAQPGIELGLSFAGTNLIDGRPVRLDAYRCRPILEGSFAPLNESVGAISLKFSLQPVRVSAAATAWYRVLRGHYNDAH